MCIQSCLFPNKGGFFVMEKREIKTSHLLFDESPLIVRPELACRVGLNESIILQQVHYWLENKRKSVKEKDIENEYTYRDGRFWTYNTYEEWQEQFPFWNKRTIERNIKKLEDMGVLLSSKEYNKLKMDRTKWYSIDYDVLDVIESKSYAKNRKMHIKSEESMEEKGKKEDTPPEKLVKNTGDESVQDEVIPYEIPPLSDEDIPHYDNLSECVVMHYGNLSQWENIDYDNLSQCVVMHNDKMSECNSTECRDHSDNLSSPIPKTSFTKTSLPKTSSQKPSVSSSSSLIEEQSLIEAETVTNEEEEDFKRRLFNLELKLVESGIIKAYQIKEVVKEMLEREITNFDDKDIDRAIFHYKEECKKRSIGQPPLFFVNGFEIKQSQRHSSMIGKTMVQIEEEIKQSEVSNQIQFYNWLEN